MKNVFEIIITVIIVIVALIIFVKNMKKSASGKCNCGNCSKHCEYYKDEHKSSKK